MPSLHPRMLLLRCNWGPRVRSLSTTAPAYAGHNKWSKIQQKKGASDQRRGQVYAQTSRDILIAARLGGSTDPKKNVALSNVLKKARAGGVPKANIESALQKAVGGKDGAGQLSTYEVLAHGSVGLIIECSTDNGNRTLHQLHKILNKHNAQFASVMYMFRHKGRVRLVLNEQDTTPGGGLDRLIDSVFTAGAEDFNQVLGDNRGVEIEFTCKPKALGKITDTITQSPFSHGLLSSELVYTPASGAAIDLALDNSIRELVGSLKDNEGTLRVWTTLDS